MKHCIQFMLFGLVASAFAASQLQAAPVGTHLHEPIVVPSQTPIASSSGTTISSAPLRITPPLHDAPQVTALSEADGESQLLQSLQSFKVVPGGGSSQKQFMDQVQSTHTVFSLNRLTSGPQKERLTGGNVVDGRDYLELFEANVCPNASLTKVGVGFDGDGALNGLINAHFNSLTKGKLYVLDIALPDSLAPFSVYVRVGSTSTTTTMTAANGHLLIPVSVTTTGEVMVQMRSSATWEFDSVTVDPVE